MLEPDGTVVPVPSGSVGVSAAPVPATGGTLMLAEPAGGWNASLNGQPLAVVPSPAGSWAQAFRLPKGGGAVTVGHPGLPHDLLLLFELLAFLVVASLALPGIKVAELEAQVAATASAAEARATGRAGGKRAAGRSGARTARAPVGASAAGLAGAGGAADDATALVPSARRAADATRWTGRLRGAHARCARPGGQNEVSGWRQGAPGRGRPGRGRREPAGRC